MALRFEPPVEAAWAASIARARAIRDGSPASSDRSSPRAWKSAPRIVSTTLRPTPADQQTSIRVRLAVGDLAGVALAETQAAKPQPQPLPQER